MAARRRFRADVPMKRFTHWRAWLAAVVSLVILNASLTFENVWPTPRIRWGHALSLELALCVLILAVAHRWARPLARRVLPAIWIVLVAGRYLDVTAPGLYGRDFNLYWDSQFLGNVTAMLARSAAWRRSWSAGDPGSCSAHWQEPPSSCSRASSSRPGSCLLSRMPIR